METDLWKQDRLYRYWLRKWWAVDFSVEAIERRAKKYTYPDRSTTLRLIKKLPIVRFARRNWSVLHLPHFDLRGRPSPRWDLDETVFESIGTVLADELKKPVSQAINLEGAMLEYGFLGVAQRIRHELSLNWTFSEELDLSGKHFQNTVTLRNSYHKYPNFSDCTFNVINADAAILMMSRFRKATIQRASFYETLFDSAADFTGASIVGEAQFGEAIFYGEADFTGDPTAPKQLPSYMRGWDFHGARFLDDAIFDDRVFHAPLDFSGCVFRGIPRFHNAEFHQDTSFRDADFGPWHLGLIERLNVRHLHRGKQYRPNLSGPDIDEIEDIQLIDTLLMGSIFADTRVEADQGGDMAEAMIVRQEYPWRMTPGLAPRHFGRLEQAFRGLRLLSEKISLRSEVFKFYRLEMLARRKRRGSRDVGVLERALSVSYDFFASYGESVTRPVVSWFAIALIFWGLIGLTFGADSMTDWAHGAEISLNNMLKPMWFLGNSARPNDAMSWLSAQVEQPWGKIAYALAFAAQSTLSLLFAFFTALALRRKFQMA